MCQDFSSRDRRRANMGRSAWKGQRGEQRRTASQAAAGARQPHCRTMALPCRNHRPAWSASRRKCVNACSRQGSPGESARDLTACMHACMQAGRQAGGQRWQGSSIAAGPQHPASAPLASAHNSIPTPQRPQRPQHPQHPPTHLLLDPLLAAGDVGSQLRVEHKRAAAGRGE
jgi:hypothetical protein